MGSEMCIRDRPMGEYNKMYNYSIETVVDAFKLKEMAEKAYDEVEVIASE